MINLLSLGMKNFFSHTDTYIDFSKHNGLVLIEGMNADGRYDSNGSGKSTVLEGIVYTLSGNTLRNVGVNDMINRNAKKDMYTELQIVADDTYDITRYRKDTKYGDSLKVFKREEELTKRLNKDTQATLDAIIDIPYNILVNTIVLGEGLSSRFTQLSDGEKKSLIESTLNLSYDLNKSRDAANAKLKAAKLQKATLEGQIATLEQLANTDIADMEVTSTKSGLLISALTSNIATLEKKIERNDVELKGISDKLGVLNKSISDYQLLQRGYESLQEENAKYEIEINHVTSAKFPSCTLCKQALSTEESKTAVVNSYREKQENNRVKMQEIQTNMSSLPDINILQSKQEELSAQYQELQLLTNDMRQILQSSHIKLAQSQRDKENADTILQNYKEYQSQLETSRVSLKEKEVEIADYDYFYKLYSPTGILTIILEEAMEYINGRMRVYTDILLDKSYELLLDKGKILLQDSSGASYQSLSNGEKRRLDLCIQFSLHDYTHIYCGASIDSLFLDEVLDTLDVTGVNNIIEVLRMKMEYCKLSRIFVISHNASLKSYFDEVITIKKDNLGNSKISS